MKENNDNLKKLITVSGPDHPGITAKLTQIISEHEIDIIDMGQAVTHGFLSLSILLEAKEENALDNALKDILFHANQMQLNIDFEEIPEDDNKILNKGEKFILNCVSVKNIKSTFLMAISEILSSHNINIYRIDNVSKKGFNSIEISTYVPRSMNANKVKEELLQTSNIHKVDISFIKDNVFRRNKRLIVFDMDSTLIQTEVIDEMAAIMGVGEQVSKITESAMNGEIDFDESLKQRVGMLKGMDVKELHNILANLEYTPGTERFISTLKGIGYKLAVISGGFTFFANALKQELGLDYAFANELEIVDDKLTGQVKVPIVNSEQKAILLNLIAQQENISIEQVVAIGDGANDLKMLSTAGLGIAFHAKEIVKKEAQQNMSHGPMTSILHFLGIHEEL